MISLKSNSILKDGDVLAVLIDNSYKTSSGGIVVYDLGKPQQNTKKKRTKNLFSGYVYWIPEDTYKPMNTLHFDHCKYKNGTFVKKGSEIFSNVSAKLEGFLQIEEKNQEITIKPGQLFKISPIADLNFSTSNRFIKPGEVIVPNKILAQKLSYLEFIRIDELWYVLVRPVHIYKVPKLKSPNLTHLFFPNCKNSNKIQLVKRFFYKNWEKVISDKGCDLIKTFLCVNIPKKIEHLQTKFEISPKKNLNYKDTYQFSISSYENINFESLVPGNINKDLKMDVRFLVNKNQYVLKNTLVAKYEISLSTPGLIVASKSKLKNSREYLFLNNRNLKQVSFNSEKDYPVVISGDLVRLGTQLTKELKSPCSGQIYSITKNQIIIRYGLPYLISAGAILRTDNGSFVKKGDTMGTLIYEKLKTTDIVQGLPKVEEILEARKIAQTSLLAPISGYAYTKKVNSIDVISIIGIDNKEISLPISNIDKPNFTNGNYVEAGESLTDGIISPHNKLDVLFDYLQTKLPVHEACQKSFKSLQLFLVNEVQQTYLSQGVQIADKHIEIIVKQMTSKVSIQESGGTMFLPGEIINYKKAEIISEVALSKNEIPPSFRPILLGITKASLNSDSFISAASFQETTRVLTEAAVSGKTDGLNGLKENVIVGRLVPAGTGSVVNKFRGIAVKRDKELIERAKLEENTPLEEEG